MKISKQEDPVRDVFGYTEDNDTIKVKITKRKEPEKPKVKVKITKRSQDEE